MAKAKISIHALRVEGDRSRRRRSCRRVRFLSTPSGWRATVLDDRLSAGSLISIHALRVEGDVYTARIKPIRRISIHALRVEGDECKNKGVIYALISIHALRVEGDSRSASRRRAAAISIHALRVEGDLLRLTRRQAVRHFYPRPPGGGRQQKRTKFSSVFAQKGEEFASLRRGKRKFAGGVLKRTNFGF